MNRKGSVPAGGEALTKKVKKGDTFIRTGPNTFGLKEI
jgi:hypothetical protein